jgi:hypothetical protein
MVVKREPSSKKPAAAPKRKPRRERTLWEKIEALGRAIPPEELAKFPEDGASNLHHYLYGAPKQDPD